MLMARSATTAAVADTSPVSAPRRAPPAARKPATSASNPATSRRNAPIKLAYGAATNTSGDLVPPLVGQH